MVEIIWTKEAADCLEQIFEYIAKDNPAAAHKVVAGIYGKIQILSRQPFIGHRFEAIADREVREVFYGHDRIPYLIKTHTRVEIIGIFHGAMDIERYLN